MVRQRQSLPAVQVWWLRHSLAVHKRAGQIYVGLWLFSRVWFACSGKDLWIQFTNVGAGTYRAIFRYSSAKVAKTAEMYVFTRRNYCTKILENIIRDFVLYVFGEDTAAYYCVWSASICRSVVEKTATDALCIISAILLWRSRCLQSSYYTTMLMNINNFRHDNLRWRDSVCLNNYSWNKCKYCVEKKSAITSWWQFTDTPKTVLWRSAKAG